MNYGNSNEKLMQMYTIENLEKCMAKSHALLEEETTTENILLLWQLSLALLVELLQQELKSTANLTSQFPPHVEAKKVNDILDFLATKPNYRFLLIFMRRLVAIAHTSAFIELENLLYSMLHLPLLNSSTPHEKELDASSFFPYLIALLGCSFPHSVISFLLSYVVTLEKEDSNEVKQQIIQIGEILEFFSCRIPSIFSTVLKCFLQSYVNDVVNQQLDVQGISVQTVNANDLSPRFRKSFLVDKGWDRKKSYYISLRNFCALVQTSPACSSTYVSIFNSFFSLYSTYEEVQANVNNDISAFLTVFRSICDDQTFKMDFFPIFQDLFVVFSDCFIPFLFLLNIFIVKNEQKESFSNLASGLNVKLQEWVISDQNVDKIAHIQLLLNAQLPYICRLVILNENTLETKFWYQWLIVLSKLKLESNTNVKQIESIVSILIESYISLNARVKEKIPIVIILKVWNDLVPVKSELYECVMSEIVMTKLGAVYSNSKGTTWVKQKEKLHVKLCLLQIFVELYENNRDFFLKSASREHASCGLVNFLKIESFQKNVIQEVEEWISEKNGAQINILGKIAMSHWSVFVEVSRDQNHVVSAIGLAILNRLLPVKVLEDPQQQYNFLLHSFRFFMQVIQNQHYTSTSADSLIETKKKSPPHNIEMIKVFLAHQVNSDCGVVNYSQSVWSQVCEFVIGLFFENFLSTKHQQESKLSSMTLKTGDFFFFSANFFSPTDRSSESPANGDKGKKRKYSVLEQIRNSSSYLSVNKTQKLLDDKHIRTAIKLRRLKSDHVLDLLLRMTLNSNLPDPIILNNRLNILTDVLLSKLVMATEIPSLEQYKELLPNRSKYSFDLRIEKYLNETPGFLGLLNVLAENPHPGSFLRCLPVLQSILVLLIGFWHGNTKRKAKYVPATNDEMSRLEMSVEVLQLLQKLGWLPIPLCYSGDILPLLELNASLHCQGILYAVWIYLSDEVAFDLKCNTANAANNNPRKKKRDISFYLTPFRHAAVDNIHRIGSLYSHYFK